MKLDKIKSVFLFAHQDDECGAYQIIDDEIKNGHEVFCLYFTSGTPDGYNSLKRDCESLNILKKFDIPESNINFIGSINNIPDGKLIDNLDYAWNLLSDWIKQHNGELKIFIPAWEGGHPDHDALHFLGVYLSSSLDRQHLVFQFPLYNGYRIKFPFFRTLSPLPSNGAFLKKIISWPNRLRFLSYCLSYPSQWKSWLGLFPPFLLHYMFYGIQSWQEVSRKRILEDPHEGPLYYELREFSTKKHFFEKINDFLLSHNSFESSNYGGNF
jgi:hypothetical protein